MLANSCSSQMVGPLFKTGDLVYGPCPGNETEYTKLTRYAQNVVGRIIQVVVNPSEDTMYNEACALHLDQCTDDNCNWTIRQVAQ